MAGVSGSGLYLPASACPHPVEVVFGVFDPPERLDVICRGCWSAFDVDSMPMDLLRRLVDHIRDGHFVPMRSEERHVG
jgi:hypothetical protein